MEEMRVVRKEGPGVDGPGALLRQRGEARDEVGPINVILKDDAPLHTPAP